MSNDNQVTSDALTTEHMGRTVQFLAKTGLSWQIWKETEPELFWLFERMFKAWKCVMRFTGDEHIYLVEMEIPQASVLRVEKALKDGSLALEMDRIHGIDPVLHRGKRDVKISKLQVSLAPAQPANIENRKTVESLERRLIDLELNERSRSIDLRVIMRELQSFQLEMLKKFDELERRVDDGLVSLAIKCEKMEKAAVKYRVV